MLSRLPLVLVLATVIRQLACIENVYLCSSFPMQVTHNFKAEGDHAALKHWYPYSYVMHDKTLFSTLCFPAYIFALSVNSVLNEHITEQSTSTFARSVSFWPISAQSNSHFTWSWHKILSFFSQMVCFAEN